MDVSVSVWIFAGISILTYLWAYRKEKERKPSTVAFFHWRFDRRRFQGVLFAIYLVVLLAMAVADLTT